jgi:hypothetical protein
MGVVVIDGNVVKGALSLTGNEGETTVTNNTVFGPLTVTDNTGVVVDKPNVVMGPRNSNRGFGDRSAQLVERENRIGQRGPQGSRRSGRLERHPDRAEALKAVGLEK